MAQRKKPYQRPVNALAPYIGKVTIAWNEIQFALLLIFTRLVGDRKLAHSIFFAAPTDRIQQRMVKDALDAVLAPSHADLGKRIKKAIDGINRFNDRRNDTIHALWVTDYISGELTPIQMRSTLRGKALADLKKEMKQLSEELMIHASLLLTLQMDLGNRTDR
jgi:hypothetical protein